MKITRAQADQLKASATSGEQRMASFLAYRNKGRTLDQCDPMEAARFLIDAKAALEAMATGDATIESAKFLPAPAPMVKR